MSKMLCAVNSSAHAQKALEIACAIAAGCGRSLTLLLVNEARPGRGVPRYTDEEARSILDNAAVAAKNAGVSGVGKIIYDGSDVSGAIIESARDLGVDHIVVGSGNPPFIGRLLMGSVSEETARHAHCTVTVAR